jgi:aspartyl-tRNA(Asn)/glutamyl-tRNA(Gln) amidotransferase subunit A
MACRASRKFGGSLLGRIGYDQPGRCSRDGPQQVTRSGLKMVTAAVPRRDAGYVAPEKEGCELQDGVATASRSPASRAHGCGCGCGSAGTACSEALPALADAPITARVKESGAVVLGSTTMPDWGMLSSGVSSLHGITRSPWNPAWTTGGSSAGAGAAAAAGFGPLHVGTDIGGSIRLPGTWLGLVAHKPSFGRVPLDVPYFGRCAGPITRTVGDAALFMQVLSQPDVRDWSSLPQANIDWSDLDLDVRGLRVAVHVDAGCGMAVDPTVAEAVEGAARLFANAGAVVEEITPFITPTMLEDLNLFWRVRSWNDFVQLSPQRQSDALPDLVGSQRTVTFA